MRYSRNIFESDRCGRTGIPALSGPQILTVILSMISFIAAICIVANFGRITAKIAIGIVNLLSSGIPVLILIAAAAVFLGRWRWRMRRAFWGW